VSPYADRARQLEHKRRWNRQHRLILCPSCPNLMWAEHEMCRDCWRDSVRKPSTPLKERTGGRTSHFRPPSADHPWRKKRL